MGMIFTDIQRWALSVWVESIKTKVVRNRWSYPKSLVIYWTYTWPFYGSASDFLSMEFYLEEGKWK